MTKTRHRFNLVVAEGELYAVGGDDASMSIEKLDKASGVWRVVTRIGETRNDCGTAVLGSKIYVLGGTNGNGVHDCTWNAFDVLTNKWASASMSYNMRTMPRGFHGGDALTVPPSCCSMKYL